MTLYDELKAEITTLQAQLQQERAAKDQAVRRIALLEASNRRAFALAAWGGLRRDREAAHADPQP